MSYAFCGFNIAWLGHPNSNVAFTLPLILWTLERFLQTGAWRWGAGLTLTAGASLLGGHTPQVFHISLLVGLWLGWRLLSRPTDAAPRLPVRKLAPGLALAALGAEPAWDQPAAEG